MGLSGALSMALQGLNAAQRGMGVTSSNVANAETPGYSRKTVSQEAIYGDGRLLGVDSTRVQRSLDEAVQGQLRSETARSQYLSRVDLYQSRLDQMFGAPGDPTALDSQFAAFVSSLEELAATPEGFTQRLGVVNDAQVLANRLNQMSADIQAMRQENEYYLRDSVQQINEALANIKTLNDEILSSGGRFGTSDLEDQRDIQIDRLAQYLDVRVTKDSLGSVQIATTGGVTLFAGIPAQVAYEPRGPITPNAQYDTDPAQRGVGTILITAANGGAVDLLQPGLVRGGIVGAARDLRDDVLVGAQTQLDQLAAGLASALGNYEIDGTAVTSGTQDGFTLDLSSLQSGNVFSVQSTATLSNQSSTVSFVRIDDPASLPLDDAFTADPNDRVVGIDFSGGMASVVSQMQLALGGSFSVSNPGGDTIQILDDGVVDAIEINAFTATVSASSLTDEAVALPFFTDVGNATFTNSPEGTPQALGFAARIQVNQSIIADPQHVSIYGTSPATLPGDSTRPEFLLGALTEVSIAFSAEGGIGSADAPYVGTVSGMFGQVISSRGQAAQIAAERLEGQQSVQAAMENRFSEGTEVNIDEEMARLVELQTAYAANARVMQTVQEMLDTLLRL